MNKAAVSNLSFKNPYVTIPVVTVAGVSAVALLVGLVGSLDKTWKKITSVVGAGLLGGFACAHWKDQLSQAFQMLGRKISELGKAEALATPSAGVAFWANRSRMSPAHRQQELDELEPTVDEVTFTDVARREVVEFYELPAARQGTAGPVNDKVPLGTAERRALVPLARETLSTRSGYLLFVHREADRYFRQVVRPDDSTSLTTVVERMEAARTVLHRDVFQALADVEATQYQPRLPPAAHASWDNRIALATEACAAKQLSRAGLRALVKSEARRVWDSRWVTWDQDQGSTKRRKDIEQFLDEARSRRAKEPADAIAPWIAKFEGENFFEVYGDLSKRPVEKLIALADEQVTPKGYRSFAKKVIEEFWGPALPKFDIGALAQTRSLVAQQIGMRLTPYLDEVIADDYYDNGLPESGVIPKAHADLLGAEVTKLVSARIALEV